MRRLKTIEVARLLKVHYSAFADAIRGGRLEPPEKSPSGDYLWDEKSIARARLCFADYKPRPCMRRQGWSSAAGG
jgi:hypothetical protein